VTIDGLFSIVTALSFIHADSKSSRFSKHVSVVVASK